MPRMDFLVTAPKDGLPQVWTVELCECGGALGGFTHHHRTAACLNACFSNGKDGTGRAPRPLPPIVLEEPRSAGGWTNSRTSGRAGAAANTVAVKGGARWSGKLFK